jgi:hypothetical protein
MNFENALRGMRNPMNSWDKSDSFFCDDLTDYDKCVNCRYLVSECECNRPECGYIIGNNDLELAQRLAKSGSDHRKFLRQIFVSVDVTAPLYWWKEMDQYRIAVTTNSTSTMHKIHAKEFSLEDFSSERMDSDTLISLMAMINVLEKNRVKYNETKDAQYWHNMIQLLPTSYNQMRTCTLNYENLINIYFARRYHKLPEWHEFCGWIEGLPYFEEICIKAMEER